MNFTMFDVNHNDIDIYHFLDYATLKTHIRIRNSRLQCLVTLFETHWKFVEIVSKNKLYKS